MATWGGSTAGNLESIDEDDDDDDDDDEDDDDENNEAADAGRNGEFTMCFVTCREGGLSRREQLVGYFYTCPLKAWPTVWLMQRQPEVQPHLLASAHVSAANTLTLLIKMPAAVTVFRGHRRALYFLPGIISLIIMCIGIIMK